MQSMNSRMSRAAQLERRIVTCFEKNPDITNKRCAEVCSCSSSTVSRIKEKVGICKKTTLVVKVANFFRDNPTADRSACMKHLGISRRSVYSALRAACIHVPVVATPPRAKRAQVTKTPKGVDGKEFWRASRKHIRILPLAKKRKLQMAGG